MLKDITFGQYFDSKSVIHRADPRVKILLLVAVIVFIFVAQNYWGLLLSALFVLFSMIITKIPVKMYLKNLKAVLPILELLTWRYIKIYYKLPIKMQK